MVRLMKEMQTEGTYLNTLVGGVLPKLVKIIDSYIELSDNPKADWKFDSLAISVTYVNTENRSVEAYEEFSCVDSRKVFEVIAGLPFTYVSYISTITFTLVGNISLSITYHYETGYVRVKTLQGKISERDLAIFTSQDTKYLRSLYREYSIPPYTTDMIVRGGSTRSDEVRALVIWVMDPSTDSVNYDILDEMNYIFSQKYLPEYDSSKKKVPLLEEQYANYLRLYNKTAMQPDAYLEEFIPWVLLWTEYSKIDLDSASSFVTLLRKIVQVFSGSVKGEDILNALVKSGLHGERIMIKAGLAERVLR